MVQVRKYEDRVQSLEEETTTLRTNLQDIQRELTDVRGRRGQLSQPTRAAGDIRE